MSDNVRRHGLEVLPQKRAGAQGGGRADAAPLSFRADGGGTYASCLGVILTEACNIRCSHCLPECEPGRTENLEWAALDRILRDAKRAVSVTKVAFTGGEPFLVPTVLRKAVDLCAELGFGSSVMTNGFWASSVPRAREALQRLPGLTELGLSTDTFHQDFIPVGRVRNAITAGHELGIRCVVRVCVLSHPEEAAERTREQLAGLDEWYTLQIQPVQPMGRAVGLQADCTVTDLTAWLGCKAADSPVVTTSGDVTVCCGASDHWPGRHPLHLGNVFEQPVDRVLRAGDENPIVHAIRLWGPWWLLEVVQKQAGREGVSLAPLPSASVCSVCEYLNADEARLLRRVIRNPEVLRAIAVGRFLSFGEPSMLSQMPPSLPNVADGPVVTEVPAG